MITNTGCLRSLGCYDSTEETTEKYSRIGRHVILALLMISTLAAFLYAISILVQCNNDTDGKECALGYGKGICKGTRSVLGVLASSIVVMVTLQFARKYEYSIAALVVAILIEVIYVIMLATMGNASNLTERSDETVFTELRRCPLTTNATDTSDAACWETFRDFYCPDHEWIMAENRVCLPFGEDCESRNLTWCSGNDYILYRNMTPTQIVNRCINHYEPWVFETYHYYYDRASILLLSISVVHIVLFIALVVAVYIYDQYEEEDKESDNSSTSSMQY